MVWSAENGDTSENNDSARAPKRPTVPGGPVGIPPPGYECKRCGKPGHYIKYCPTNGDPTFDRDRDGRNPQGAETGGTVGKVSRSHPLDLEMRSPFNLQLHGVPANSKHFLKDITGVDTTGMLVPPPTPPTPHLPQVKKTKDGYEILEPSAESYQAMIKQGYVVMVLDSSF
jgi:hypothetical protein